MSERNGNWWREYTRRRLDGEFDKKPEPKGTGELIGAPDLWQVGMHEFEVPAQDEEQAQKVSPYRRLKVWVVGGFIAVFMFFALRVLSRWMKKSLSNLRRE